MKTRQLIVLFLLSASVFGATQLHAENNNAKLLQFGIKAGLQTQKLEMLKDANWGSFKPDNGFGYQFGLTARVNLPLLYIQPELIYSHSSFVMNVGESHSAKVALNNFEVPVLLGVKLLFFNIFAGPTFNLSNNTTQKKVNMPAAFNATILKSAVGYQAGAGVQFMNLTIDARYCGQFKAPEQTILIGDRVLNERSSLNSWQFSVGYFF